MKIASVQSLLRKYGIAGKKRLGQHFLLAMPTVAKIVAALECEAGDVVVEIGAGLGTMTAILAPLVARVFAIEKDPQLLAVARQELRDIHNVEWIDGDILRVRVADLVSPLSPVKIIGNLPYNISSPILFWMLDQRSMIQRAVIMLQKEVALRVVAKTCTKDYGILSVLMQACADCKRLFDVSAKSFIPPPEVTSSVIRIDFHKGDCGVADEASFRALVKAAFGKRRKTIRNALIGARSLGIRVDQLDSALASLGINPTKRAEALSVKDFISLANGIG